MKKKLLNYVTSFALAASFLMNPIVANAADMKESMTTDNISSEVKTETGTATGSDQTAFVIAIPQTIILKRSSTNFQKFEGSYQVNVKAMLADPSDYISVVPDSTFTMTKSGSATTVTASVDQEHEKWTGNPSTDPYDKEKLVTATHDSFTDGTIEVTIEEAGEYTGTLGFTVNKG